MTGRIYDRLKGAFSPGSVFRDVDTIPFGVDFRDHVASVLNTCRAVLVVIGPAWSSVRSASGVRRVDQQKDHVRIEIEHALAIKGIRVVPVLVGGAKMPEPEELPESLSQLAFLNAAQVRRDPDFHPDVDRLLRHLMGYLKTEFHLPPEQMLSAAAPVDRHSAIEVSATHPTDEHEELARNLRASFSQWAQEWRMRGQQWCLALGQRCVSGGGYMLRSVTGLLAWLLAAAKVVCSKLFDCLAWFRFGKSRWRWLKVAAVVLVIAAAPAWVGLYFIQREAGRFDLEELQKMEMSTVVYDRKGSELSRICIVDRDPVSLSQVPHYLVDAMVASLDPRFYQHSGIDYSQLANALDGKSQTITHRLACDAFGSSLSKDDASIVSAFIARRIEGRYTKTEILELYLNRVHFGASYYGVQSAAQGLFGKSVENLSLEESASLVGLLHTQEGLDENSQFSSEVAELRKDPSNHPQPWLRERNIVFSRMVEEGYISELERTEWEKKPMITAAPKHAQLGYIKDAIRQELEIIVGEERAAVGGFKVFTLVDPELQVAAEKSVRQRLTEIEQSPGYDHQTYDQYRALTADYHEKIQNGTISPDTPMSSPRYIQAATMVIENKSGGVLALVGGFDYKRDAERAAAEKADSFREEPFETSDRVLKIARPAGTAFVPFVYAAAFAKSGFSPISMLDDSPIAAPGGGILGEWGAEVTERTYSLKPVSARTALTYSYNNCALRMGELVGLPSVQVFAQKAGIKSPISDNQSSMLGESSMTLSEICNAFTTFPNQGRRSDRPRLIMKITDREDRLVYEVEDKSETAVDPIACYQTHSCLVDALERGTGSAATSEFGLGKISAAGKTGTTEKFTDLWFLGYTSQLTAGVWVGFDEPEPVHDPAFSNRFALPIWTDVMNAAEKQYPSQEIKPPVGLEKIEVCRVSGLQATEKCVETVRDGNGQQKIVRAAFFEHLRPGTLLEKCPADHGKK
ncbi:MAG: transglycosylase domain-containing protein [Verrucomicrobiaceae bacterium]|nr:transglycosylase domain-containing protein [Verrucomicrobiaceae bacterium]